MNKKNKILILDDEIRIVDSLTMLLEDYCEVICYTKAFDALNYIRKNSDVRLVISDYRMPEMSGYTFLNHVRRANADIFRIILTGYADAVYLVEAIDDGIIQELISKPFKPEFLIEFVQEQLDNLVKT